MHYNPETTVWALNLYTDFARASLKRGFSHQVKARLRFCQLSSLANLSRVVPLSLFHHSNRMGHFTPGSEFMKNRHENRFYLAL